ncbi:hypothetical protein [Fredinandcohnia quinoae]|uniref:Uncharacterized protein n=1 Tax=Fredinandcohnia quinoae TaxID=2918902 RepID=A0AAW5DXS4_9BACI|nr:hypothetical protein [Fredinandcohnia sp. SECRCQ15]MCH1624104.1 hypothetical protein [Fredinandcohnia sp. SECRCQ15]
MKQSLYGLILLIILALPPVANFLESIMIIHMHMQMPLLVFSGFLMARFFQLRFPSFFEKWNGTGVPGILLFIMIMIYWTIPKTMDETLNVTSMEVFKFFSLPFLAGIPLRDSWKKLTSKGKNLVFLFFTIKYFAMGLIYVNVPVQLCNNYLRIDQITLGWGFLTTAICIVIYLVYVNFTDKSKYE